MANLPLALQKLAEAADVIDELTCYDYVPDLIVPPCFYTADVTIKFDDDFGGSPDVEIICRVLTARSNDEVGQKALLGFMSPTGDLSIKAALEAARGEPGRSALDGACDDFHVRRMQGHRLYTVGEKTYYGAEWVVHLIGNGDQ